MLHRHHVQFEVTTNRVISSTSVEPFCVYPGDGDNKCQDDDGSERHDPPEGLPRLDGWSLWTGSIGWIDVVVITTSTPEMHCSQL